MVAAGGPACGELLVAQRQLPLKPIHFASRRTELVPVLLRLPRRPLQPRLQEGDLVTTVTRRLRGGYTTVTLLQVCDLVTSVTRLLHA